MVTAVDGLDGERPPGPGRLSRTGRSAGVPGQRPAPTSSPSVSTGWSDPTGAGEPAWLVRGSHSNLRGRYQFQLPSSFIVAGSRTARTTVASTRTATANPTPNC